MYQIFLKNQLRSFQSQSLANIPIEDFLVPVQYHEQSANISARFSLSSEIVREKYDDCFRSLAIVVTLTLRIAFSDRSGTKYRVCLGKHYLTPV